MIIGNLIGHNSFDVIDLMETQSSIYRSNSMVRLSYKDEDNRLVQFVKTSPQLSMSKGDLLVTYDDVLMPTHDRKSQRTVAKLLANGDQSVETKQVTIGVTNYTAKLMPVELI